MQKTSLKMGQEGEPFHDLSQLLPVVEEFLNAYYGLAEVRQMAYNEGDAHAAEAVDDEWAFVISKMSTVVDKFGGLLQSWHFMSNHTTPRHDDA